MAKRRRRAVYESKLLGLKRNKRQILTGPTGGTVDTTSLDAEVEMMICKMNNIFISQLIFLFLKDERISYYFGSKGSLCLLGRVNALTNKVFIYIELL